MALKMTKYTLNDFDEIQKTETISELNYSAIQIINSISKKVGAPTYRKTPVFRKKKQEYLNKQKVNGEIFKKTVFHDKLDEDEINQDKIRGFLNKLTNTNYDEMSEQIIINIKHFVYSKNEMILLSIGKSIFEIGTENKFWVGLYAKLYNNLIKNFPVMQKICMNNFENFMSIFEDIKIVGEEDYDLFCKVNKENTKRRSLTLFYTNLYKQEVLNENDMFLLLDKLIQKTRNSYNDVSLFEEIFENILIILSSIGEELSDDNQWDAIVNNIIEIYEYIRQHKISKKIMFKISDVLDDLDIDYE
jgi:hypothetical protein